MEIDRWVRDMNGGLPYTAEFSYNMFNLPKRFAYPNGQGSVIYEYNDAALPARIREEGTNIIYAQTTPANSAYNEAKQALTLEFYNSVSTSWTYDPETFRTEQITSTAGAIFQDLIYEYTPDGNVGHITDNVYSSGIFSMDQVFHYDRMDRLVHAYGQAYGDLYYAYDKTGNILSVNGAREETYAYSGAGPHAASSLDILFPVMENYTFDYDGAGNLTAKSGSSGSWDILFDYDHKPYKIDYDDGFDVTTAKFYYDHTGERAVKIIDYPDGTNDSVVYFNGFYENRMWSGSNQHIKNVQGFGKKIGMMLNNNISQMLYYHPDLRGSTNEVTDSSGAPLLNMRIRHTPFGRELNPAGSIPDGMRIRFTGMERDAEDAVSLDYFHARYYDPILRRFISPDPLVPHPLSVQSYNRYSYVRNNPMSFIDPTGLNDEDQQNGYDDGDDEEDDEQCVGECEMEGAVVVGDSPGGAVVVAPRPAAFVVANPWDFEAEVAAMEAQKAEMKQDIAEHAAQAQEFLDNQDQMMQKMAEDAMEDMEKADEPEADAWEDYAEGPVIKAETEDYVERVPLYLIDPIHEESTPYKELHEFQRDWMNTCVPMIDDDDSAFMITVKTAWSPFGAIIGAVPLVLEALFVPPNIPDLYH